MASTRLARRRGFQLLHKDISPAWADSARSGALGACFTPAGPAHNFEVEVYIEGPMDIETGMIMNLADVDMILKEAVEPLDGKPVRLDSGAPTTERLAHHLMNSLQPKFSGAVRLVKVRLYEYEDLWVDAWT